MYLRAANFKQFWVSKCSVSSQRSWSAARVSPDSWLTILGTRRAAATRHGKEQTLNGHFAFGKHTFNNNISKVLFLRWLQFSRKNVLVLYLRSAGCRWDYWLHWTRSTCSAQLRPRPGQWWAAQFRATLGTGQTWVSWSSASTTPACWYISRYDSRYIFR